MNYVILLFSFLYFHKKLTREIIFNSFRSFNVIWASLLEIYKIYSKDLLHCQAQDWQMENHISVYYFIQEEITVFLQPLQFSMCLCVLGLNGK